MSTYGYCNSGWLCASILWRQEMPEEGCQYWGYKLLVSQRTQQLEVEIRRGYFVVREHWYCESGRISSANESQGNIKYTHSRINIHEWVFNKYHLYLTTCLCLFLNPYKNKTFICSVLRFWGPPLETTELWDRHAGTV